MYELFDCVAIFGAHDLTIVAVRLYSESRPLSARQQVVSLQKPSTLLCAFEVPAPEVDVECGSAAAARPRTTRTINQSSAFHRKQDMIHSVVYAARLKSTPSLRL